MADMLRNPIRLVALATAFLMIAADQSTFAQSVGLPAPRLLTTMPMGGQAGTKVDVTITGDHLDDVTSLLQQAARAVAGGQF